MTKLEAKDTHLEALIQLKDQRHVSPRQIYLDLVEMRLIACFYNRKCWQKKYRD